MRLQKKPSSFHSEQRSHSDDVRVLYQKVVGQLIKMATEKGCAANPNLKLKRTWKSL
ncbi:putative pyruvate, phosphate dikinase [Helianthus annuus]|nr:putative pyruvate, phosphate dikinase [Helianthus annuus]KAJ0927475.1 putative pyruvate, phosphate dikinase [Helianthus annuus]